MEDNIEIWKDVKGFEGHYQVSNFGNVKGKRTYVGTFPTEQEALNYQTIATNKFNEGEGVIPFTKKCTSNCKGVHFCKKYKNWVVRVTLGGNRFNIGRYKTEQEACNRYNLAISISSQYQGDIIQFRKILSGNETNS